jgi:hypothetical protein
MSSIMIVDLSLYRTPQEAYEKAAAWNDARLSDTRRPVCAFSRDDAAAIVAAGVPFVGVRLTLDDGLVLWAPETQSTAEEP